MRLVKSAEWVNRKFIVPGVESLIVLSLGILC